MEAQPVLSGIPETGRASGLKAIHQLSVAAVIDGGSPTRGAHILVLGKGALGRFATRPAAVAPLSLRWQGQSLQLREIHACQPDRGLKVFPVFSNGRGIAFLRGVLRQHLVVLAGGFGLRLPHLAALAL